MKHRVLLVAVLLLFLPPSIARSQTPMPDEKQSLITKLITTTGADKNVGTIFDAFMRAYIAMMPQIEEGSFKITASTPPGFRKELIALANQTMKTIADRTRQRVLDDPNIRKLELEIVSTVWNETFSEDELRQLLEFYATPAGQKLTRVGPAVAIETSRRTSEIIAPLIGRVFDEVQKEELEKLYEPVRQLEKKYHVEKRAP
jgi:hypothetical protein